MKHRATLVLAFLLICQLVSAGADTPRGDWPQWLGPNRSNFSMEAGLLKSWPEGGPPILWKATGLGHGVASVAVSAGRVYTVGYRDDHEYVTALDVDSGNLVWATQIGPAVPEAGIMRWLAQRTPTVDGERIYAVTAKGLLICLETTRGKELWRKDLIQEFAGKIGIWGFCDCPLIDGERLICTPGGSAATILALKKTSGEVIWKSPVPDAGANAYSALMVAEFSGVRQYVNFLQNGLISVAAGDGKFLWRYNGHIARAGNTHNLILLKDGLFSANGFGAGCVLLNLPRNDAGFQVIEKYRSRVNFQSWFGTAIRLGDHVFTLRDSGLPRCQELQTGKIVWQQTERLGSGRAIMTYADGHLYIRYTDGKVVLFDATQSEGKVKSEFMGPVTEKEPAWTMPVVTGGRLYLRDQDRLLCYNIQQPHGKMKEPDAIYVSTPQDVVDKMLELAAVRNTDRVYDLGCGDGRIVVTAARVYGASAVGIDIDSGCITLSLDNVKKHKVEHLVRIEEGDFFKTDLSKADVVALYLLPNVIEKLIPQLDKLKPGSRVIAHHFPLPGLKPDKVVQVESSEDLEKHTIYLWITPFKKAAP